jgi:hypothetical protein
MAKPLTRIGGKLSQKRLLEVAANIIRPTLGFDHEESCGIHLAFNFMRHK